MSQCLTTVAGLKAALLGCSTSARAMRWGRRNSGRCQTNGTVYQRSLNRLSSGYTQCLLRTVWIRTFWRIKPIEPAPSCFATLPPHHTCLHNASVKLRVGCSVAPMATAAFTFQRVPSGMRSVACQRCRTVTSAGAYRLEVSVCIKTFRNGLEQC